MFNSLQYNINHHIRNFCYCPPRTLFAAAADQKKLAVYLGEYLVN